MSLENCPSFLLNFSECEMNGEEKNFYQFKSFRLSVEERQLLHNGDAVSLTPKAFDVLAVLVERSGHLVEKDELLRNVWSDSFVEEANVARIVHTLRKVLGKDENGNKFIETVAKKGYRFVAEVDEVREPIIQKSTNGNHNSVAAVENFFEITVAEKLPEAELQIPPSASDETDVPLVHEQKHTARFTLIAVGFLSAVFLLLLLSFNFQSESSVIPSDVKSIAVLPLKPLTAENRDSIYELGIADSLILKLSPVKGLKVRPLSATRQYTDVGQDAIAAGREQNVDYVLASNYQIADGKIRITSQLFNVRSGLVEEIFTDEQNNSNRFAVQDAITANIGQSLLKRLNREPNNLAAKHYTTNEEAYRLYLQGTALADKRNRKDAEKAIEYFEQAVKLDPNYAPAYAGLANAHTAISMMRGNSREQYPKAKAAIDKALAIDDNLAEAHSYFGEMKTNYEWDFAGAEREHKRAVELNPNSSTAHRMYALLLGFLGRFDEAIAEIKTAIDLEPASVLNHQIYGQILYFARRYDEAIAQSKRTVEMDANFLTTYRWIINSYRIKGDNDQAFEWFMRERTREGENAEQIQLWKTIYAESGWRGVDGRQFEKAKDDEKKGTAFYIQLAHLCIRLEMREQAFAYLEKAFGERRLAMTTLKVEPRLDSLRSDPRFDDLVKRVGLK
ncbi:MAG: winged helix-turn-helix domain-containing protein [Acidobacteriota bacterium]|nr:winged helix-turn-helix domain-containing protein [Acidobacteriota bacterium]